MAKEQAALAVMALAGLLPLWVLMPPPSLEGRPLPPPEKSALTPEGCEGSPWPKAVNFSREELEAFERDGYVVLRNFITPKIVEALTREARHVCATWPGPMDPKFKCFRTGTWLRHDVSRDFLYYGPVGETVSNLLQVPAVRIQEDGFFVHSPNHGGQPWHTDMDMYGGIFSEFHRSTKGVAFWIPLTNIDHETNGGSVYLVKGGPKTNCSGKSGHWARRQATLGAVEDPSCEEEVNRSKVVHSLRAGDAMIWHPWMPHKTQPSTDERLSWYGRVLEADAVFCHSEYRAKAVGRQALCKHDLRPGDKAHHVCFQQIYPLLDEEVAQRMNATWRTPIMQPSPLGDLSWRMGKWWDKLRMMRLRGLMAAPTLEKPECIN